jgi:hypothetical protein
VKVAAKIAGLIAGATGTIACATAQQAAMAPAFEVVKPAARDSGVMVVRMRGCRPDPRG